MHERITIRILSTGVAELTTDSPGWIVETIETQLAGKANTTTRTIVLSREIVEAAGQDRSAGVGAARVNAQPEGVRYQSPGDKLSWWRSAQDG